MALIDALHQAGIGVILDWVPSHFPDDAFALADFDGTHLYDHADPRRGVHPDWGSLVFNYGRHEVRSFLASSADHWLRAYHADGLRVDAVASMLYLDYSRKPGEWIPNRYGGREDLDAVSFLQQLNTGIYADHPDVQTIAEESTAWPGVSRPVRRRGARLRAQVGHGLDARHAAVLRRGPDPPAVPPQRAHLPVGLRRHRELRAAPVPRRGGPRQGLVAGHHARGRLAEVRQPPAALRLPVRAAGQEAALHGVRARPSGASGTTTRGLDWDLLGDERHAGLCAVGGRPQPALPG